MGAVVVKDLRDKAIALREYARRANNMQLEIDVAEIRFRAERRLGEMLKEQPKNTGTRGQLTGPGIIGGSTEEPPIDTPTLADLGIDKKLSARAQAIADIPEDEFERTLAEHREEQQAITGRTIEKLAGKAHVSNNSGEFEWYTPPEFIEAARKTMGGIGESTQPSVNSDLQSSTRQGQIKKIPFSMKGILQNYPI